MSGGPLDSGLSVPKTYPCQTKQPNGCLVRYGVAAGGPKRVMDAVRCSSNLLSQSDRIIMRAAWLKRRW